ncbi:hypothetical protein ACE6H2_011937 [Prunus campanulata]
MAAAWDMMAEISRPSPEEGWHESVVNVNHGSLYESLKYGDWNATKEYIDRHPESLTHRGSSSGGTALHEAIEWKQLHIVEELLKLMTEEDLEIQDGYGCTAFFYVLTRGMALVVASMINIVFTVNLGIHDLHEMRLGHDRILQILRLMCDVVKHTNLDWNQTAFVQKAILRAVEGGQVKFVKEMCKANLRIPLMKMDERGRSIFLYAVECRQEKVFNLIYGLSEYDRNAILTRADDFNNTILHAAGVYLHILIIFKEVESIVPPLSLDMINFIEKMTAREVFTKNHKELVKKGEELMKGIATSCTVVGALIVTIMFAAAFTAPANAKKPLYLQFAKLEEDYGLAKCAMKDYDEATKAVPNHEKLSMYEIYIARVVEILGIPKTREIYEQVIETGLPDKDVKTMCSKYAEVEKSLGEIDRARGVYIFASQFLDPRSDVEFWNKWHDEFEVQHGNEDTFREMLRIRERKEKTFFLYRLTYIFPSFCMTIT